MRPYAGSGAPLGAGERVVLHDRKGRRYLVTLEAGRSWHSHAGVLDHDDVIGRDEGVMLRTSLNMEVLVLRPTLTDVILKMPRGAQVIYPKDIASILGLADIRPGVTVVEAGAGSGALSMALLQAVGASGKVISYERREEHLVHARRNVAGYFGEEPPWWQPVLGDLEDHLAQLSCDRLVLDVLEPWKMVKPGAEALQPGGVIIAYMPTVTQVTRLVKALEEDGRYGLLRTQESLVRTWQVDGLSVRPDHRMVAHTAFLTTARRLVA